MTSNLQTLERAFELARSGQCSNVQDIRLRLRSENYTQVDAHLSGQSVRRQLLGLCREARERSTSPESS